MKRFADQTRSMDMTLKIDSFTEDRKKKKYQIVIRFNMTVGMEWLFRSFNLIFH